MVLRMDYTKRPSMGISFKREITVMRYAGEDDAAGGLDATALVAGRVVAVDVTNRTGAFTFTDPTASDYFLNNVILYDAASVLLFEDAFWGISLAGAAQNDLVPILWSGLVESRLSAATAGLGTQLFPVSAGELAAGPNASADRMKVVAVNLSRTGAAGAASMLFDGIHGLGQIDNVPV